MREGIINECLYWLTSIRAQSEVSKPFLIAPVHEAIPAIRRSSPELGKLHFRGDFIVLWSEGDRERTAIIDVKSDFGGALDDKYLRKTAELYREMGFVFYFASPSRKVSHLTKFAPDDFLAT